MTNPSLTVGQPDHRKSTDSSPHKKLDQELTSKARHQSYDRLC